MGQAGGLAKASPPLVMEGMLRMLTIKVEKPPPNTVFKLFTTRRYYWTGLCYSVALQPPTVTHRTTIREIIIALCGAKLTLSWMQTKEL